MSVRHTPAPPILTMTSWGPLISGLGCRPSAGSGGIRSHERLSCSDPFGSGEGRVGTGGTSVVEAW